MDINIFKKHVEEINDQYFFPALSALNGNVLEIGFGDGNSFSHYNSNITVYGIEASKSKTKRAAKKNNSLTQKNIKLGVGFAESLEFENEYFDAVVLSFVLCSVKKVERVIGEIKRVLKRDGKIILLEHIRSKNSIISRVQDIFSKPYALLFRNCHLNRNPKNIISENNFKIETEKTFHFNAFETYLFIDAFKI